MIVHLERFVAAEQPAWDELDAALRRFEDDPFRKLNVEEAARFYFLYQRAANDLSRLGELAGRPDLRARLESLVRRAYAQVHSAAERRRFSLKQFLLCTFPHAFRAHLRAFALSSTITVAGVLFGAGAMIYDRDAKPVLMPFAQLMETPAQRVHREEAAKSDRIGVMKSAFAAELMTHNMQVSFFTLSLGTTFGIGSVITLFYNGVTLGAVAADYLMNGYGWFLFGWLIPHGVIEIPAILIAGQGGLLLGGALIGWGDANSRRARLRAVGGDVLALAGGLAVMLVWAGVVEAFLSQYHQPVIPYAAKIAFGLAELFLLMTWLLRGGRA